MSNIRLCATCLSSDRSLIQIQNRLFYTDLWQDVSLQMTDYICWECKAMFNNIWRFKQQVLTAQDVLRNQNLTEIKTVQCLSKLTRSIKTSYDSEYYEDDVIKTEPPEPPSVDCLDETVPHEEVHFTDDCSRTEPMKTEMQDVVFKVEIEVYSDPQKDIAYETEQFNNSPMQNDSEVLPFKFHLSNQEKKFIVNVMTEEELLKARESDRELSRYKKSPYKCEKCIVGYFNEEQYKNHFNVRHAEVLGGVFCRICEVRFSDHMSCNTHTARHYISYRCRVCEFGSHRISVMAVHHSKEHEVGKTYRCNMCEGEFLSKRILRYHREKEHRKRPSCTICEKQFTTQNTLKLHMLSHKGVPLVRCEICKKQYKNIKVHMYTHQMAKANENAFCAECNIQFKSVARYKLHLTQNSKHADPEKFSFECSECGKRFFQKTNLIRHLNAIHYNKKDHVCQICGKSFIRSDSLKQHMLYTHEGASKPRKYMCSYCDKAFTIRSVLVNHIRTHTGERPFHCEYCDAKFAQKVTLKTHVKGVHKKLFKSRHC